MKGTKLQNYYIEELIGAGGMGQVYKATDTVLGRTVAVKSLNLSLTHQDAFTERFKNEAKTLARLAHPNIALLYNFLEEKGNWFMIMEYVEGRNLDQLLSKGRIPYEVVVPVMVQVLEGLGHAHHKGVLHRDIKPANIMLTREGTAKLMDFGIARVADHAKLTQMSRVIGTLEFLAPELIEGREPSIASDIYALGVSMYEMLTGKLPFSGKSDYMLMQEILQQQPLIPGDMTNHIPGSLSYVMLKMLEKDPEKRYSSAAGVMGDLKAAFPALGSIEPSSLDTYFLKAVAAGDVAPATHVKPFAATRLEAGKLLETTVAALPDSKRINTMPFHKRPSVYLAATALIAALLLIFVFAGGEEPEPSVDIRAQELPAIDSGGTIVPEEQTDSKMNKDYTELLINKKKPAENVVPSPGLTSAERKPAPAVNKKPASPGEAVVNTKRPESLLPEPVTEPEAEETRFVSGTIKLRGHGAPVVLSLRESISEQTASEGQKVTFKVVEPVTFQREVIIPAGSVITGNIKGIGSRRMSILLHTINAKGKSMRLERSEFGAGKETVFSGKTFKTSLRGTLTL